MLFLCTLAMARPTDGGSWSFNETDTITSFDDASGLVRVWYSTEGDNVTLLDDTDGSGVPDFVEDVANTAADVLATYEETGFRLPLSDDGKGGSNALDAYLVDFAGNADGLWASESCDDGVCSGYFTMENDFSGYGYGNLHEAVAVLTSHELFHGVQAAYAQSDEVWLAEGTATWAEHLYDPLNNDFVGFCGAYLEDPGRPFYEPPAGPVPSFAYGTALWFYFLDERYGSDFLVDLLDAYVEANDAEALVAAIETLAAERGGSLAQDFGAFSQRNLATGSRAGAFPEEYSFAGRLPSVPLEAEGDSVVADDRFYPLSTTYYRIDHPADVPLYVATDNTSDALVLSVHPVDSAGNVLQAAYVGTADAQPHDTGLSAAGEYFLVVSNTLLADNSTKLTVCLGDADAAAACASGGDTGIPDDSGATDDSGSTDDSGATDDTAVDDDSGDSADCGCSSGLPPEGFAGLYALFVFARRRR